MPWLRTSLAQRGGLRYRPCRLVLSGEHWAVPARPAAVPARPAAVPARRAAVRESPLPQGRRAALWTEGQLTFATWGRAPVPTSARGARRPQPCPAVDFLPGDPPARRAAPLPAAAAFPG